METISIFLGLVLASLRSFRTWSIYQHEEVYMNLHKQKTLFAIPVFVLVLLVLVSGCASDRPSGPVVEHVGVEESARTIQGLRLFQADDGKIGSLEISDAYQYALAAVGEGPTAILIWDKPSFVVNNCYFFTVKEKFGYRLSGVLVDADSGRAALVEGSLAVR
jgi:hypothetical protein